MSFGGRKIRFRQYQRYQIIKSHEAVQDAPHYYKFLGVKDENKSKEVNEKENYDITEKYIYIFKTKDGFVNEVLSLKPKPGDEYQLLFKETGVELKYYFCLSQIKLSQKRIDLLTEQIENGECCRAVAIPIKRNYKLLYTEDEKYHADFDINITTIYLNDYIYYFEKLYGKKINGKEIKIIDKSYLHDLKAYKKWMEDTESVKSEKYIRSNLKALSNAVMFFCNNGPKKVPPFFINMVATAACIGLAPTMAMFPATIPGFVALYIQAKDFFSNPYRHKLKRLDKEKKEEMPGKCPDSNGWTDFDYFFKKFKEKEKDYIMEYNRKAIPVVEWISQKEFIACQFDYFYAEDSEDRNAHSKYFAEMISHLSVSFPGKEYIKEWYLKSKICMQNLNKQYNMPPNIKNIQNKEIKKITESERQELLQFSYKLNREDDWLSTYLFRLDKANECLGYIFETLAAVLPRNEIFAFIEFPLTKHYLTPFRLDLTIPINGYEKGTMDYIETLSKKLKGKKIIVEVDATDGKKVRKIKYTFDKADVNLKFYKEMEVNKYHRGRKEIYRIWGEAKIKYEEANWAEAFLSSDAALVFSSAIEIINILNCVKIILDDSNTEEKILNSIEITSSLVDLLSSIFERLGQKAAASILGAVYNAIECFLSGWEARRNYIEDDNDAAICYTVSAIGSAATAAGCLIALSSATGPIGPVIAAIATTVTLISKSIATYLDDDSYEVFLKYCLWGEKYSKLSTTNKLPSPDWLEGMSLREWNGNVENQLIGYENLVYHYKVSLKFKYRASDQSYYQFQRLRMIHCIIDTSNIMGKFSCFKITLKINDKTVCDKKELNDDIAVFELFGNHLNRIHIPFTEEDNYKLYDDGTNHYVNQSNNILSKEKKVFKKAAKNNWINNMMNENDDIFKRKYKTRIKLIIELDLFDNGKKVIKREITKEFEYEKLPIPITIRRDYFEKHIILQLDDTNDKKVMYNFYKKRRCKGCKITNTCKTRKRFNKKFDECMKLLNDLYKDKLRKMTHRNKNQIRALLYKSGYYDKYHDLASWDDYEEIFIY